MIIVNKKGIDIMLKIYDMSGDTLDIEKECKTTILVRGEYERAFKIRIRLTKDIEDFLNFMQKRKILKWTILEDDTNI